MPEELRDCPQCGAKNALETFLRIDLDEVVVSNGEVVSFVIARSANEPSNGIVVEEARVTCLHCGHELNAIVPTSFTTWWRYSPPSSKQALAEELALLLNDDWPPAHALEHLGFDEDDYMTEEHLSLDDPDNAVIDLLSDADGSGAYVQRHGDRWQVHTYRNEPRST